MLSSDPKVKIKLDLLSLTMIDNHNRNAHCNACSQSIQVMP